MTEIWASNREILEPLGEFLLNDLAALIPIVDPIGLVPIFLLLTAGEPQTLRAALAGKVAFNTVIVLTFFWLVGSNFLQLLGISLAVIKIAGGIVVFQAGWESLYLSNSPAQDESAAVSETSRRDITIIPMTIPLSAGPGAIAVTLSLAARTGRDFSMATEIYLVALGSAIAIIGLLVYGTLRASTLLLVLFKENGIQTLSRLLGLFILAIGVQLVLNGIADWLSEGEISGALIKAFTPP